MQFKTLIPEPPTCTRLNSYGGYTSNVRGSLFYTPHLDKVDNPGMLPLLQNAYRSTTTTSDYQHLKPADRKIAYGISVNGSGFTNEKDNFERPGVLCGTNVGKLQDDLFGCEDPIPNDGISETLSNFTSKPLQMRLGSNFPLVGEMESGFTRSFKPNPTDGRVMDPVYLGQDPKLGTFGPSVTHFDYPWRPHLTGKEITLPLSCKNFRRSGFWQSEMNPNCYLNGEISKRCSYQPDYLSRYKLDYPRRDTCIQCSGCKSGKIKSEEIFNLFQGENNYITETMDRFRPIPPKRAQGYPTCMSVKAELPTIPTNPSPCV